MKYFVTLLLIMTAALHANDELKPFPPAGKGMTRHVINLPSRKNEDLLRVELLIGKKEMLDPANRYFFGGNLEKKSLQGWGYEYYELKEIGPMAGTLMAVDPQAPQVERFITLGGEPRLLRYNSRLPLVVYVPEGVSVLFRVWRAEDSTGVAIIK